MKKILIIGGGASGMTAAIAAARAGASVTVLEHMDRVGKKILSTGNGKCNYMNRKQGVRFYRGGNPAFVQPVLRQFGFSETAAFFRELGIYPRERNGCFYPASGQASSVLDALRMELRRLKVQVLTGCEITAVKRNGNGFLAKTGKTAVRADCCIFACGGLAFPKSGSDGSAFPFIRQMGHTFVEVVPALVQLKAGQAFLKAAAGVRTDASVKLYVERQMVCEDRGEVQLTEFGISGIPVFQVSRYAAKAFLDKKHVQAALDFVPFLSGEELQRELTGRFGRRDGKTAEEALNGLFSKKLIPILLKQNGILPKEPAAAVSERTLKELCRYAKNVRVELSDTKGFAAAQVSAGGVDTGEIHAETMESALVPGLYFAGEVVDVDGMCGGYNLQWAWSSGYVAGMHAAMNHSGSK